MSRYLIVNADDFGLSEAVSRGIIKAHREGILTSTTFMVNFPWAAEMAPMLKEAPDLGVGVHLNLTTGAPVLPAERVPTLVNGQGQFSKDLVHLRFRVDLADVRREWCAQVERGIALLGGPPTHLDTHRYLQGFPGYAAVLVEVARTYHIPAVRCLYPGSDLIPPGTFRAWNPAALVVNRYLKQSAAVIAKSGLAYPTSIMAGDFDLAQLIEKLQRVGDGVTEIVTHPGSVDDQLRALSSLVEQREVELAALTDPGARRVVADQGLQLVSFRYFAA